MRITGRLLDASTASYSRVFPVGVVSNVTAAVEIVGHDKVVITFKALGTTAYFCCYVHTASDNNLLYRRDVEPSRIQECLDGGKAE